MGRSKRSRRADKPAPVLNRVPKEQVYEPSPSPSRFHVRRALEDLSLSTPAVARAPVDRRSAVARSVSKPAARVTATVARSVASGVPQARPNLSPPSVRAAQIKRPAAVKAKTLTAPAPVPRLTTRDVTSLPSDNLSIREVPQCRRRPANTAGDGASRPFVPWKSKPC